MNLKCWNCGVEISDPFSGKITFRATCEACGASLHCCRNCMYYMPRRPNDCMVPNTEFISDRSAANFCEEFKLSGKGPTASVDPKAAAKRLFGDDSTPASKDPKKRFNSLFSDEDKQEP